MNQLFFWTNWQKPYKELYWGLLMLFFATIAFFIVGWSMGDNIAFPWETYVQRETIKIAIESIQAGPFQLPLEIESYLLVESFQGGDLTLYKWPAYVFVAILGIVFSLAITCISTLKRFWYLVGMGLVIVFLMSLQLENLHLFGRIDKSALIGVFILYLPLSYYYQFMKSSTLFSTRLIGFSAITVLLGTIIFFGADVQYPFLYVATYGYTAPVILSLLFILMIGHQILTGFMYIITKNNNAYSKNTLTHFLVITSVYLINLAIVVLNEIKYLYWELFNIHPFVLLLISALIGVLLYSLREETYKHIYQFYPIGGFIYLMLGSICFFTIGYYLFSANDSIIEVFEDFILYAHLGYGFIFLIYILANFLTPLGRNMQVYRVLYTPDHMPYFTYRFAGSIVVLAFILVSNYKIPIYHAMAAYYNGIGDLHSRIDDQNVAKAYYRKGTQYDYRNHRANYTLGSIYRSAGDNAQAAVYFNEAMIKRPTPQSFVNMGNIYLEEGKFFDGLFTIRDGMDQFPDDDRIKINLGLLFDKANEPDSAFLAFEAARNHAITERSANVNMLSLINKGDYLYDLDSIVAEYVVDNHTALVSNALVLSNANQQFWDQSIYVDSMLNMVTGYALYNQAINNIYTEYADYLRGLQALALYPGNGAFREKLLFATALGYYYHHEVARAYRLMDQLAVNYQEKAGYYLYIQGLWSLDQQAPLLAVDYFEESRSRNFPDANLALAIATMEAGLMDDAKAYWKELLLDEDPVNRQMAESASRMIGSQSIEEMNDAQRYWYWKYQINKENEILSQEIIDATTDDNYKSQITIELMRYFLDKGDTTKVLYYSMQQAEIDNPSIQEQWNVLNMAKQDLLNETEAAYQMSMASTEDQKVDQVLQSYYHARFAAAKGDTTNAAMWFGKIPNNPFFEQGVIGHAKYLADKGAQMEAYSTLIEALEINPYAVNLRKQYILQCAVMDFDKYAEHALEALRLLVSSQEYYDFRIQYEEKLSATQEDLQYFED
jgi:hypothetical protein